jgi:hypothetical protein
MFLELLSVPEPSFLAHDLHFKDFYQLDIYLEHIAYIKRYILDHPDMVLYNNDDPAILYTYEMRYIYGPETLVKKSYDFTIHLRLEDVAGDPKMCISTDKFISLLSEIPIAELGGANAIVVNSTGTDYENRYIGTVVRWFRDNGLDVTLEQNDIYTDFNILSNSKVLVCSMSTMSWCAALLSDVIEKCYFPDYVCGGQTFKRPIANTVLFKI